MEDGAGETKTCSNCKRDIPVINFLVHTIHCARNIKVCPACKEPVPHSDLEQHHESLHKLKPCKQCGESVCGSDLDDHLRDSCALTVQACRYCELELPRSALPPHEGYCGARTERCADCREYVMLKYRQLHLDSNHGFIKLDDDPSPLPIRKEIPKTIVQAIAPYSNGLNLPSTSSSKLTNLHRPNANNTIDPPTFKNITNPPLPDENRFYLKPVSNTSQNISPQNNYLLNISPQNYNQQNVPPQNYNQNYNQRPKNTDLTNGYANGSSESHTRPQSVGLDACGASTSNGHRPKRTNDRPQVNTAVAAVNKISKDKSVGGAVKKRPAPPPPPPPRSPTAARALQSALQRQHDEEGRRRDQTERNLALGLPPVLSAAAKLDKLRKMDALHNREVDDQDYKSRLQGRVWRSPDLGDAGGAAGQVLGRGEVPGHLEVERRRNDFCSGLQPMSEEQFARRFQQLSAGGGGSAGGVGAGDRFSEIKSSLRELRRGLNEVTSPYNATPYQHNNNNNNNDAVPRRGSPEEAPPEGAARDRRRRRRERRHRSASPRADSEEEVQLPCEFCNAPVPAQQLVLHQTGCRPALAQLRAPPSPPPPRTPPPPHRDPVIPCEFCTESLPVYMIQEHQERCRGQDNMFPV